MDTRTARVYAISLALKILRYEYIDSIHFSFFKSTRRWTQMTKSARFHWAPISTQGWGFFHFRIPIMFSIWRSIAKKVSKKVAELTGGQKPHIIVSSLHRYNICHLKKKMDENHMFFCVYKPYLIFHTLCICVARVMHLKINNEPFLSDAKNSAQIQDGSQPERGGRRSRKSFGTVGVSWVPCQDCTGRIDTIQSEIHDMYESYLGEEWIGWTWTSSWLPRTDACWQQNRAGIRSFKWDFLSGSKSISKFKTPGINVNKGRKDPERLQRSSIDALASRTPGRHLDRVPVWLWEVTSKSKWVGEPD